ncbi:hypothetical protein BWQ96_09905 [Gracilariopsis chorda]|uniref:Phosphatidic acid phosphatase type 2/haloperoxidase domain-containing protein n=1 Tax=Gracilariopsis chorda TaxID=448386 RepID=A0A2V3IEA2_9FLOR|nr:hypothetical protein BWQ96_09905 [Gracilariopsis chorda]|eukprot:PXF40387.1 hypothetical protein BWQ96_09905 [Gracilariopsis chorda]
MDVPKHPHSDSAKPSASPPPNPPVASRFILPARTRFQLPFPSILENGFASFDNRLVALCQRRTDGFVHYFSMGLTFFTSIEVSLVTPPALYALGYDSAAGLCASVLLVLGIISQVPKKFIFRPRPWMVGRALPIRQDRTSSFPSRAVVCAVVFSWLIAQSLHLEGLLVHPLTRLKLWSCILAVASLTAFARINVGAHYPSDTILGFILGLFVITVGSRLETQLWHRTCPIRYAQTAPTVHWAQALAPPARRTIFVMTLLAYTMTLISIQGFWVKCSYVYGLLMASTTFRATYLCAHAFDALQNIAALRQIDDHGSFRDHVRAVATFVVLLVFGMLTRSKKGMFRVVSFTIIYIGTLLALIVWRLRPPVLEHT